MRMRTELWQGHFGYWQNRFIHHNILMIGYTAWVGYMTQGRGMVVCDVVDVIPLSIDWSVDAVAFRRTFIPSVQVTTYLHSLALMQEAGVALLNAIATYDPTHAMVVLVMGNGAVDINLLQNLAIAPADCYTQVQQRWAEFQPDLTTPRKHS